MRILLITLFLVLPNYVSAHGGGLNSMGCHTNSKTGDYHCHRGNNPSTKSKNENKFSLTNETEFNQSLALLLGVHEAPVINHGNSGNTTLTSSVRIDRAMDEYVIEGGLDKRSS